MSDGLAMVRKDSGFPGEEVGYPKGGKMYQNLFV